MPAARYILSCIIFVFILRLYQVISVPLGLPFRTSTIPTEIPLVLALYATFLILFKRSRRRVVWAAVPVFVLYIAHDYYLLVFGEVPTFRDASRIPELVGVLSSTHLALSSLGVAAFLLLTFRQLNLRALGSVRGLVLLPWLGLFIFLSVTPANFLEWARGHLEMTRWSKLKNTERHGRIFMSLFREAEASVALEALGREHKSVSETSLFISKEEAEAFETRNVHVVVLESFIDAGRFESVHFNRNPLHDELLELIGDRRSFAVSPHFSGGTAESEFEVLCGVPALGRYGFQEFKLMDGSRTYCLPEILRRMGYATRAAHPYKRSMYNRTQAYRSLGFELAQFWDGPLSLRRLTETSRYVLDRDLYKQMTPWVEEHRSTPVFNYGLTMEGHTPFELDPKEQPVVVKPEPYDPVIEILANESYYRSHALVQYFRKLTETDPSALFVAVADHLPPMADEGAKFYEKWGLDASKPGAKETKYHSQFLLVIDRGEAVDVGSVAHFEIYQLILDRLSNGRYCSNRHCFKGRSATAEQEEQYRVLLAAGLGAP